VEDTSNGISALDSSADNITEPVPSTSTAANSDGDQLLVNDDMEGLEAAAPNQPASVDWLPVQKLNNRTLTFQISWFKTFPWLHCPITKHIRGVICFFCGKAAKVNVLGLAKNQDDAFVSRGFCTWEHAIQKFRAHEKSSAHLHAVSQLAQLTAPTVVGQLSKQKEQDQSKCRVALCKLFTSLRYLAKQGLAVRGHETYTRNYQNLLKLRAEDSIELHTFLQTISNFTALESQNEMLSLLSHSVVRHMAGDIKRQSKQYSIIVDGTQDMLIICKFVTYMVFA